MEIFQLEQEGEENYLQGIALSVTSPAASAVCVAWSPLKKLGVYLTILSTQFQVGQNLIPLSRIVLACLK